MVLSRFTMSTAMHNTASAAERRVNRPARGRRSHRAQWSGSGRSSGSPKRRHPPAILVLGIHRPGPEPAVGHGQAVPHLGVGVLDLMAGTNPRTTSCSTSGPPPSTHSRVPRRSDTSAMEDLGPLEFRGIARPPLELTRSPISSAVVLPTIVISFQPVRAMRSICAFRTPRGGLTRPYGWRPGPTRVEVPTLTNRVRSTSHS